MDKRKFYIIGDPAIRAKIHENEIRDGIKIWLKCTVYAFAFIGFIAVLAIVCQISAW